MVFKVKRVCEVEPLMYITIGANRTGRVQMEVSFTSSSYCRHLNCSGAEWWLTGKEPGIYCLLCRVVVGARLNLGLADLSCAPDHRLRSPAYSAQQFCLCMEVLENGLDVAYLPCGQSRFPCSQIKRMALRHYLTKHDHEDCAPIRIAERVPRWGHAE